MSPAKVNRRPLAVLARLAVTLTLACFALAAHAERYALLVGVGEVKALPARLRLRGPDNDVALMREALIARGFAPEHIRVLARHARPAAAPPTYTAIRQAMNELVSRASHGDTIVLHLAGHGTKVPQRPGGAWPEPDGLDEVFLAEDTQPWDAATGRLPNALLDDEIGAWMDALVDRGAAVWALFDTCHAGGMARAGSGQATRWRAVGAAELGVPMSAVAAVAAKSARPLAGDTRGAQRPPRTDGRVLAYAARGHELTGEEWLPRGGSVVHTRMHGVFSYAVAQALREGAASAAELQALLRGRYAAEGRAAPTPQVMGEGVLSLDRPRAAN